MVYIVAMPELLLNNRSEFKSFSQKIIYVVYVTMANSTHQEERLYIHTYNLLQNIYCRHFTPSCQII